MLIAVTGTHGSGKTTLVDDFADARRDYVREQEPYWSMVQDGVAFAGGPTVDDLQQQLEQSCGLILAHAAGENVVFDRCPLDFVAYLEVGAGREGGEWTPSAKLDARMARAMSALDLVVFLPLSEPDEIAVRIEYPRLRRQVDRRLAAIIGADEFGLFADGKPRLLRLRGTRDQRLRRLLDEIG